MTRVLRRAALLAALTGAFLSASGDALAVPIVACNTVIAVPGAYELVGNLNCPVGDAITIAADGVNLDLGGFTVSGQGTGLVGIDVTPGSDNVFVFGPGTVRGFDTGIQAGDCGFLVPFTDTYNLSIDNVTVRNSGSYGIALCPIHGDMAVSDSQVIGTDGTGIANPGLASIAGIVVVFQTLVRDSLTGIDLDTIEPGSALVLGSAVVDAASTGVQLSGTGYAEFSDGWIRCPSGACTKGITMSSQDASSLIARNTISGVDLAAIEVFGTADFPSVTVEDNLVRSVGGSSPIFHGAIVLQDRGGFVRSNTVRDVTGGPGIHAVCANALAIEDNVLRAVDGDGIIVDDVPVPGLSCVLTGNADVVEGNLVVGAGGNGIVVASGLDHQLTGNAVLGSSLDGLLIGAAATGFLTDNRARASGGDGFQLDTGALTLTGNMARRNSGWGFLTVAPVTDLGGNQANNNTLGNCDPLHLTC